MNPDNLDILAFGAHADDVEIGMGGTIAKFASIGKKIGICDLTRAELSSNGTIEIRKDESLKAAGILGVNVRETLNLPDRGLFYNQEYIKKIAEMIRKYRPALVFAPYMEDRHPDHGHCARLVEEAVFSAGIRKYETGGNFAPHKVKNLHFYMINGFLKPDFLIDITSFMDKKIAGLESYQSQFTRSPGSFDTPLVNGYIETVAARESLFGKQAGVQYAEGFKVNNPLLVNMDIFGGEL
ncbi:bacillithiol biosynthesis deacetylase BshB1 [Cytobacillus firmus]|uniref:N-acetylglucosaminyl-L-malate N-acetyl hydrolase n=1 Tax=Cytobacillus firmus TaxID=1399 RepID=A0A380XX91_CYTFI|nr:bacillithiol biosynthesis deacetylase BshB1 [Cytobacillus firmus]KAF0825971.1 N-acetylglucosaminyl-L-malate N-acetyl hydrolase [Cytobacillus firmus]MBG9544582.1 deacetylase [Cytobacillus firmus]MBG9546532.1 deacetylase [Cytobacillus firmus]MBG9553009.1 deacetylase [Cytobacillus firmus]MBG9555293.1 deacetylase [Cytobacillus firmus]